MPGSDDATALKVEDEPLGHKGLGKGCKLCTLRRAQVCGALAVAIECDEETERVATRAVLAARVRAELNGPYLPRAQQRKEQRVYVSTA